MYTPYDYLDPVTPDVSSFTLGEGAYEINPQGIFYDGGGKTQEVHLGDDGSEERIDLGDDEAIFYFILQWEALEANESGVIYDIYFDPAKANAKANSFKFAHPDPDDGHTYVVRFDCDLERARQSYDVYGIFNIRLRILGVIEDPI
jgi:hypothetical protein